MRRKTSGMTLGDLGIRTLMEARQRLRIGITPYCNLKCFFCHGDASTVRHHASGQALLSPRMLCDIARVAIDSGVRFVKLTGGEPFQYQYESQDLANLVHELAPILKTSGVDLSLVTNAVGVDREKLREVHNAGLSRITISLHSASKAGFLRYAAPQHPQAFDEVVRTIHNAVAIGFNPVKVNTVLYDTIDSRLEGNQKEIGALLRLAEKAGVAEMRLFVLLPSPQHGDNRLGSYNPIWRHPLLSEYGTKSLRDEVRRQIDAIIASGVDTSGSFRLGIHFSRDSAQPRIALQGYFQRTQSLEAESGSAKVSGCSGCLEGSYAIRVLPEGTLKSCLFDSSQENLASLLATRDRSLAVAAYRRAQDRMHDSKYTFLSRPTSSQDVG